MSKDVTSACNTESRDLDAELCSVQLQIMFLFRDEIKETGVQDMII